MIRKKIFRQHGINVVRGTEIYRIEALSDAVFAFSISLLIMSLEVPKTFEEMKLIIKNFLPFLATVSLVFLFWNLQNRYFRIYGLNDALVIVLNLSLLVLILFYVYPLKFLFSILLGWLTGINYFSDITQQGKTVITQDEFPQLILFFSIGYAVIWLIFYLLYNHAYKKRVQLQCSYQETIVLQYQKRDAVMNMLIGIASLLFSIMKQPGWSGLCFLLIPAWLVLNNVVLNYKLTKAVKKTIT
jgi:uncharacterized membrane protein